jgi:hypothetical protein
MLSAAAAMSDAGSRTDALLPHFLILSLIEDAPSDRHAIHRSDVVSTL